MGVLNANGGSESAVEETDVAGGEDTAQQETTAERPRAEDGTFVPAEKLKPQQPGSRRNKTQEQIDSTFDARMKAWQEEQAKERQSWQQQQQEDRAERQRLAEETARLRGMVETYQRMPQQQAPAPALPDPDKLQNEADAALEAGNIRVYQAKMREVARAEAALQVRRDREEWQKTQPQQGQPQGIPLDLQMQILAHPNVAKRGKMGLDFVAHKDQELALYGHPPGEARRAKAFELADKALAGMGQQQARPAGYSPDAAAALSGVPMGNRGAATNASSDAGGVRLNQLQEETWRKAGFSSAAEYLKWGDPSKYGLV